MYFLVSIIFFTIFFTSNVFSLTNCLTDLESNNYYNFQNVDYTCSSGYDFSNLRNMTYNCNNRGIYILNGPFSVLNSSITFINCSVIDLPNSPTINFDANTNITLINSRIENNNFLSWNLGRYTYHKNINFNVVDYLGENVPVFDISLTSIPTSKNYNFNTTKNTIKIFEYNNGVYTNENNFTLNVNSVLFNSANSTTVDLTSINSVTISLRDNEEPKLLRLDKILITNISQNVKFVFDEKINGTFYLYNSTNSVIDQRTVSGYLKEHSFLFSNLGVDKLYKYSFDVYDRFGHRNDSTFIGFIKTYINLNSTKNSVDNFVYSGDPQNTSSFNFSSNTHNIKLQYLEPVNLSNNLNLSNRIIIGDNFVYVDSADLKFNKKVRIIFSALNYQTTPVILKNGLVCNLVSGCNFESYNPSINTLIFNVSGFSNYSTISNSVLNLSYDIPYAGENFNIYANYYRYNDSSFIDNSSCEILIDSVLHNMIFNSTSNLHQINFSSDNYDNLSVEISCTSPDYDDKILLDSIQLIPYPIDNFSVDVKFVDVGQKLTKTKYFNVTITSDGNNNTGSVYDTKYYFLITKDITYPQTNWNITKKISRWVEIGKNEFFEVYNNGEEYTTYRLFNSTIGNFSEFVFIDQRDINGDGTSLFVTVKACVTGGFCKYYSNDENNMIYQDVTPPNLIGPINIRPFYNSQNIVNFTYRIRDLESKVSEVKFDVIANTSSLITPTNIIPFLENQNYTYISSGYNFLEGKSYKILLVSENLNGLQSFIFESADFLIDTIEPYNSTIDIDLNQQDYYNDTKINVSFSAGIDYDLNYSLLGLKASGIDYMKLYVQNSTLNYDNCNSFGIPVEVNETFSSLNTSYVIDVNDSYCYKISYRVYDRAGNYDLAEFNRTIKVDMSPPVVNLIDGKNIIDYTDANPDNAENIQKYYSELNSNSVLFKVRYDITDNGSDIDFYTIEIINNQTGQIVKRIENYSSNIYEVKFNNSYIFDNTNYKVRVWATNKAGLNSTKITTNGATVFLFKVPRIEVATTSSIKYKLGDGRLFDFIDNGVSSVLFDEISGFNLSCKYYLNDISYQNDSGVSCTNLGNKAQCNFNTNLGMNNFYVSCKSDESVKYDRTYNNMSNNYDLKIYVEENIAPIVSNLSNSINVSEGVGLNNVIYFEDLNLIDYKVGIFRTIYDNEVQGNNSDNLSISYIGSEDVKSNINLIFVPDNTVEENYLDVDFDRFSYYNYYFYFNGSINYSEIKNLCLANSNCDLIFNYLDGAEIINSSVIIDFFNSTNLYIVGLSKQIEIVGGVSNLRVYNISYDENLSKLIWDGKNFFNYIVRKDSFNVTFNLCDEFDCEHRNLKVNVMPIYHKPLIDSSYYLSHANLSINQYGVISLDLKNYFDEDNSIYGLDGNLSYVYSTKSNVEFLDFDSENGIVKLYSRNVGNGYSYFGAKNKAGQVTLLRINFSVVSGVVDNIVPKLNVVSPANNFNLVSGDKTLFVNLSSNENLLSIDLINSDILYNLCYGSCYNYSGFVYVSNLVNGNNAITLRVTDLAGNINSTNRNIIYSFDSSSNIYDTIYSNVFNGSFSIGGNKNLESVYSGNRLVRYSSVINSTNYRYLEFNNDFTINPLILWNSSLIFGNDTFSNFMLVTGIDLINSTKTIYIPIENEQNKLFYNYSNIYSSVCIKDSNINSISQISSNCKSANEFYILCDGLSYNGYSCNKETQFGIDFYKISGLKNSGVKIMCTENWQVGNWSACSGSTQTRSVVDLNNCGTQILMPVSSQSCSSGSTGGSSGGSSGGGGGGSSKKPSSGGGYIPPVVTNTTNTTKVEPQKPQVEEPKPQIPQKQTFVLGDLTSSEPKKIEVGNFYSLIINGNTYTGELLWNNLTGDYSFVISQLGLDIGYDRVSYDINSDGNLDELYLSNIGGEYFLNSNVYKQDLEPLFPIGNTGDLSEKNSGFNMYLIIGIVFVLVVLVGGISYYFLYYKKKKESENSIASSYLPSNLDPNRFNNISNGNVESLNNYQSMYVKPIGIEFNFEQFLDNFTNYLKKLKDANRRENIVLGKVKQEMLNVVKVGFSWVDVYYYLKSRGFSDSYIKNKIVDFNYLADEIETFVLNYELNNMTSENLKQTLLKQKWASDFYIYDGDGKDILREVLFMITGSYIYGFRRDKFLELFNDEFERGKKLFKNFDFSNKFKEYNISTDNFDKLFAIEKEFINLREELSMMKNGANLNSHLSIDEKNDISGIISELEGSLNVHL